MPAALSLPQQVVAGTASVTAGTTQTQAGATALTGMQNLVTTGNANDGVILPKAGNGAVIAIVNLSANALKVYPPTGGKLNGGTANASVTATASKNCFAVYHSEVDATIIQAA